jgi:adenylate kinase family enzyme
MSNRIHIIGGPGSGKTTLARQLAAKHGFPHVELDTLFWDNADGGYAVRRDPKERDRRLALFVEGESWVVEGVYWGWCQPSFERADQIILLDMPTWIRQWRLGLRFIKRRMGLEKSTKKETFKGCWETARWNARWNRDNLAGAKKALKPFEFKVKVLV